MDWIDEKLAQFKNKLKNMTLKQALGIYILIAIIIVGICYSITLAFCESWRSVIHQKYGFYKEDIKHGMQLYGGMQLYDGINMQKMDNNLIKIIDFIEPLSIFIYSILAIVITAHTYFKNKLEEPMNLLMEEAKYISRDDLSFICRYESGDEMGGICEAFDKMRNQLAENQKNMWDIMEEQRRLNAAFAHDLRTPLTVMQGYTELLTKYYPQGKITEEKLLDTLTLINSQVSRLKKFSETMKSIHTFDAMEVSKKKNKLQGLERKIEETASGLQELHGIKISIRNNLPLEEGYYDEHLILEVVDNLLSNALRYAKATIDIVLEKEDDLMYIYIRDDGRGFTEEELYMASRPYYSDKVDSEEHFGIGLTICKTICQKHGGNISFTNSTKGGAIVCANFFVM